MTAFGRWDFGLSTAQEERAAKLHRDSIICDLLFQGPLGYRFFTSEMVKPLQEVYARDNNPFAPYGSASMMPYRLAIRGETTAYKDVWDECGVTAGTFEVTLDENGANASLGLRTAQFDNLPWLTKALRADDFRRAKASGGHAAWLNCQNTTPASPHLDVFDTAWTHGLRMFQLAYNLMNHIASGCTERADIGVSRFGELVIRHLNQLGVIVDTSHCSRRTTLDACEISSKPVVASHTSVEALHKHARAKSDEEIHAIAATGGVIGVYAVPEFLNLQGGVTIETMIDHVAYLADLVGAEHVAIGTDWPLQLPKWVLKVAAPAMDAKIGFRPEDGGDWELNVEGFDDYRDWPNITRGLVARGYTDEVIKGILGENFLRVFEAVCG